MFGCCGLFSMLTGRCRTFMFMLALAAYVFVIYLHSYKTHANLSLYYADITDDLVAAYKDELTSMTHGAYPGENSPRIVDIAEQNALHDTMMAFHERFDEENTLVLAVSPATVGICAGVNVASKLVSIAELVGTYTRNQMACPENGTIRAGDDPISSLENVTSLCDALDWTINGGDAVVDALDRWFDVNGAWFRHRTMFTPKELDSIDKPYLACSTMALTNKAMVFYDTVLQVLRPDYQSPHGAFLEEHMARESRRLLALKVDYVSHMVDSMQGGGGGGNVGGDQVAMQTPVHAFTSSPETTQNIPCESAAQCKAQIIDSAHYTDLFRHFIITAPPTAANGR